MKVRPKSPAELLDLLDSKRLTARAKKTNSRVKRWVSVSAGSNKRVYRCNLCGAEIASEAASWPVTAHAAEAVEDHRHQELHG